MRHVLVIEPIHRNALRLLDERPDIEYVVIDDPEPDAVLRHIVDADAITVRAAPVPAAAIDAARNLRVVSRHGVGYDNVPIEACTARGIPVTIVGDVNTVAVAEHAIFLLLTAARAGAELDAAVRAGDFAARDHTSTVQLAGRTLLVVGFGRIGREVANRAAAFGMRVLTFDPWLAGDLPDGVERIERLDDALAHADAVTLPVPLTDDTRHLLDARALDLLPRGAIVVNTARGGLVDERALLARVRSGRLFGAGLDVFEDEPVPASSPLVEERRIALSPHSAALTEDTMIAMGVATVRNVLAAFDGELDPALVVNPTVLG